MANIVIASNDSLCQSLATWLITNRKFQSSPPIDTISDGGELVIIAYDNELGDGTEFIKNFFKFDFPMTEFKVKLTVCSAAGFSFFKDLITPAEIANSLNRSVYAFQDSQAFFNIPTNINRVRTCTRCVDVY